MAGYVFARKNFRGKELIYGLFVAFMFVNVGSVTLRPLFELAVKIHMKRRKNHDTKRITGKSKRRSIQ